MTTTVYIVKARAYYADNTQRWFQVIVRSPDNVPAALEAIVSTCHCPRPSNFGEVSFEESQLFEPEPTEGSSHV